LENEVLIRAWAFTPGFIIWNVWKERNKRIFKNEKANPQKLYDLILKQIRETVSTTVRNIPEIPPSTMELRALKLLGLHKIIPQGLGKKKTTMNTEKDCWQPPLKNYLKLNIDGASKGNPRLAGSGGVLRNEEGRIILIFHSHLGKATNNMAELMAMEQGLEILIKNRSSNVIIEADSEITINSVKRISCGSKPEKVSNHWRLIQVYQRIQAHLQGLGSISFNHVRRNANKLADILANQGVNNEDCMMVQ